MYEIGVVLVHRTRAAVHRSCLGRFRRKWVKQEFAKISSANWPQSYRAVLIMMDEGYRSKDQKKCRPPLAHEVTYAIFA